uniref:protein rep n=1 Tax=Halomonas alkaliantarctica TaxID=232346 RepID=UPI0004A9E134
YAQREGAGKKMVMVTFTHPHRSSDALAGQLKRQSEAFKRLRAGEPWKRILPSGYMGLIRSLEVTHGRHGWHPHTHEAWMVDKDADVSDLRRKIVRRWYRMLKKVGMLNLPPSGRGARFAALRGFYKHSVDVLDNARSSDYLAKHDADSTGGHWGADRELAKGSTKRGRAAGRTPFQLLADCRDGDEKSGRLYLEYVEAMRGKATVFWSAGLKALVGLQEFNDQQIAEREDDAADVLGAVELRDWALVRRVGYRAHLLQAAESGGWPAVQALITELRARHGKTSIKQEWAIRGEQSREFTVERKHHVSAEKSHDSDNNRVPAVAPGLAALSAPHTHLTAASTSKSAHMFAGESGDREAPGVAPDPSPKATTVQKRASREVLLQRRLYEPILPD